MRTYKNIVFILVLLIYSGCKRSEFLDKKPNTSILTPTTLKDFQALLENNEVINAGGVTLAQLSSDEFTIPSYANWQGLLTVPRNAYIWAGDIYNGQKGTSDWDNIYKQVFFANSVLDGLNKSGFEHTDQGRFLKGWALFVRGYGFYDLVRNYCRVYDPGAASSDLGIPLRLKSGIDYMEQRSTMQESLDQIFSDLFIAEQLLPEQRPSANLNRPSKIAVYALLARISLDTRDYEKAEVYADKSLALYSNLTDYNNISKTSNTPFPITNPELIYISTPSLDYSNVIGAAASTVARINVNLINLYNSNDLRLPIYFAKEADGSYRKKRGYSGAVTANYPFYGLATDELFLIKAECLARRNQVNASMDKLNQLLIRRFAPASFRPATSTSAAEALNIVLLERQKELVWRGLRWFDLKRLNKEGANITLTRQVNEKTYTLPPNDNRWVFPIYPDEVALSGIKQNPR
ncbi:SusD family protein [Pedobacter sp. ok626]|uniref:RagB/SusD family nutrient uptake outer membrane protein n=1 Tax=Pedobacter sp. ok626 TaxID=1761882 RepID=UPI000884C8A0|nr:RagB/SusD family nutrient uptake outer membrane protein [Pedobacter sp. ok626]SDJ31933.1 SusD family protein [Pedobacter sp. ok626]